MTERARIVLRRRDRNVLNVDLLPGEYRQDYLGRGYGDLIHTTMRCPMCATLSALSRRRHRVDHDGVVEPALVCANLDCDWARLAILDGWVPEAKGSA